MLLHITNNLYYHLHTFFYLISPLFEVSANIFSQISSYLRRLTHQVIWSPFFNYERLQALDKELWCKQVNLNDHVMQLLISKSSVTKNVYFDNFTTPCSYIKASSTIRTRYFYTVPLKHAACQTYKLNWSRNQG